MLNRKIELCCFKRILSKNISPLCRWRTSTRRGVSTKVTFLTLTFSQTYSKVKKNSFKKVSFIKTTKEKGKIKERKKLFKEKAKSLINDTDRYWLFIYEVLPKTDLPNGEFRTIKDKKVSFVKNGFL